MAARIKLRPNKAFSSCINEKTWLQTISDFGQSQPLVEMSNVHYSLL